MPLPFTPKIPTEPVPFRVDGIIDIQRRAAFWARLATIASVVTGGWFVWAALNGVVGWPTAVPFFLLPWLPISTQTRIEELRTKVEEQLRDRMREGVEELESAPTP